MPMNPRLLRPLASGVHPEAAAWRTAVVANGGSVSASTMKAVSTFCAAIDAAGIRDRFYRLNLFCGNSDASLIAPRVPLYRGPSRTGTQYGNTIDTNVNFVQGDYSLAAGLQGNGTTKFLRTGLTPDTVGVSTGHMAAGLDTYVPGSEAVLGAQNSTTDRYVMWPSVGVAKRLRAYWGGNSPAETVDYGASTPGGVYVSSRTSETSLTLYRNGSSVASLETSVTPGACPYDLAVFGTNNTGTSSASFSGRMKFYSAGLALSGSQVTAFTSALQAFMTAIGRSAA